MYHDDMTLTSQRKTANLVYISKQPSRRVANVDLIAANIAQTRVDFQQMSNMDFISSRTPRPFIKFTFCVMFILVLKP